MTDLDLAEVERLLEAPQGLVETVALARVVPALLSALKAERERGQWRTIESAPKDGTCILLLSKEHTDDMGSNGTHTKPAKCAIGRWWAEGDAWADEYGRFPDDPQVHDDSIALRVTGVWLSGGGWFQPNEVTHWQPLPSPPGDRT